MIFLNPGAKLGSAIFILFLALQADVARAVEHRVSCESVDIVVPTDIPNALAAGLKEKLIFVICRNVLRDLNGLQLVGAPPLMWTFAATPQVEVKPAVGHFNVAGWAAGGSLAVIGKSCNLHAPVACTTSVARCGVAVIDCRA